ncbi:MULTISPECIES: hypothetical protein [Pseudomonas]|jgi:hypothetical protein|uniref:hypothetical protein n=1 Tax=Pseudomonas TaxID=286 RepID=UPI0018E8E20F|nr:MULTISPECIES: hypothetical protein [Pseudomonas]MBJ2286652.1 hypothetical protein [Pseudomonas sp. MF6755]MDH0796197.1 hypothetical protein [Pseudomonas carnis]
METVVLETKDTRGKELWINRDDNGDPPLFCLECNFHSMGGRDYDELPRYYRTERGARMGAARITGEKLVWTRVGSADPAKTKASPKTATVLRPRRPRKPTQLQQGILYAAADLARFIVQVEDAAALLRRQGLAEADCSDLDEMDKEQLRVLRDDFGLPLRGLD